jgi:hypothetical protein
MILPPEPAALADTLAGIVAELRGRPYARLIDRARDGLAALMAAFDAEFADHLDEEDGMLFPALEAADAGAASALAELREDHEILRRQAWTLRAAVVEPAEAGEAHALAREFLALLLDHARRERDTVARLAVGLDEAARRAVEERLQ